MKSLVLKHDIATMYKVYLEKHKNEMPNKMPVGKTLFYDIANHITGGGKHQEARSGIDYIKVNFHKDNFVIVDKVIDVLVPLSEMDHTLREKLYSHRSDTYTFLNYCYAVHIREALEAFNETVHLKSMMASSLVLTSNSMSCFDILTAWMSLPHSSTL